MVLLLTFGYETSPQTDVIHLVDACCWKKKKSIFSLSILIAKIYINQTEWVAVGLGMATRPYFSYYIVLCKWTMDV